jgi:hypothetical protein
VKGDPVQLRQAIVHLASHASALVDDDGILHVRLTNDGDAPMHVAVRCEIAHETTRIEPARLEHHFGGGTAQDDAAPGCGHAAAAWALVSRMGGEHGFDVPRAGGFRVWFTLTLPKYATAASEPAMSAAPVARAAPHAPTTPVAPATPGVTTPTSVISSETEPGPTPFPPVASAAGAPATRRMPRLPQELLVCNLGPVLELGCDGLRVHTSCVPEGLVRVTLPGSGDEPLKLPAAVESSERLSRRTHDVLLRFVDITPQMRQQVLQVAMAYRPRSARPITSIGEL